MNSTPNDRSISTTWEWKRVKVSRRRRPEEHSGPQGHRWRRFRHRDPRQPITVRLVYRGGPEAWVQVEGRGEVNRYPGHTSIYDLLADINQLAKAVG